MTRPLIQFEGLDHVVLRTRAPERLEQFYTQVLGCRVERRLDIGLVQLRAGNSLIDLVDIDSDLGRRAPETAQAHNLDHYCLRITGFNQAQLQAHLAQHGASTRPAAHIYGARGFGPSLYVEDPDGNTLELKSNQADRPALAADIYRCARLTGEFELRSGAISDTYFDKYQFEAEPALLGRIAGALAELIPEDTQVLAGLEMGGIPIVTMMSQVTGLPCAFIRKQAKTYGTARYAEGADLRGARVALVEDVVSSGGALLDALSKLRADDIVPSAALCVIDRNGGGAAALGEQGVALRPLFTMDELLEHAD